jgi:hypothetical protein
MTTESAFVATASRLARTVNLYHLQWRHHALGMLQAELDERVRIHVWHPELREIPKHSLRAVHDHRFDIESAVVIGQIIDKPYIVTFERPYILEGFEETRVYEIRHAKIQRGTDDDVRLIGAAWAKAAQTRIIDAGLSYRIERRSFHTTNVHNLAVTVIFRANFDELPARILDYETLRISGIIKNTDTARVKRVLDQAHEALHG